MRERELERDFAVCVCVRKIENESKRVRKRVCKLEQERG